MSQAVIDKAGMNQAGMNQAGMLSSQHAGKEHGDPPVVVNTSRWDGNKAKHQPTDIAAELQLVL
jgi:hypothetical protein